MKSQSDWVWRSAVGELTISFAESAVADLEAIRIWYAEQGVPEFDQPWLRELIFPPFRIVYRREATRARIVRVWRSERLLMLPDRD